jgi:ABC-2 type transport system permease protein
MSVVRRVAAVEWRMLRADRGQRAAAAVFAGCLILAVALGVARARAEQTSAAWLEARAADQFTSLARAVPGVAPAPGVAPSWGPSHPDFVANDRGTYAVLPPAPLLELAVGQTDLYPSHFRITARLRDSVMTGDQIENPLWLLTGHFDLAFVVLYLYPLLILATAFDLTASERRSGTLRMLLAQPITLGAVLGGKALVRVVALLAPVIVAPLLAVMTAGTDAATTGRLALWTAAVVAYGAVWLGLALAVNAYGRTAATNALALAGAWMASAVIVPAAVNLATLVLHPVPSRVEFANAARVATRDAVVQGSQLLGHFMEDHPTAGLDQGSLQQFAVLQAARDEEVARRLQPVLEQYEAQLARQHAFVDRLRYLSPTILAHGALVDIAGTSGWRHRDFTEQAGRFQQEWSAFFEPFLLRVSPVSSDDYAKMPRFVYREEALTSVAGRTATPIAALALLGAVLAAWGARVYRSYDLAG